MCVAYIYICMFTGMSRSKPVFIVAFRLQSHAKFGSRRVETAHCRVINPLHLMYCTENIQWIIISHNGEVWYSWHWWMLHIADTGLRSEVKNQHPIRKNLTCNRSPRNTSYSTLVRQYICCVIWFPQNTNVRSNRYHRVINNCLEKRWHMEPRIIRHGINTVCPEKWSCP